VASVTPEDWGVEILDENFEKMTGKEDADLVGITSMIATVTVIVKCASYYYN